MSRQQVYIFVAEDTIELETKINWFIDRHINTSVKETIDELGNTRLMSVIVHPRVVSQSIAAKGKKLISQLLVEYDCDK